MAVHIPLLRVGHLRTLVCRPQEVVSFLGISGTGGPGEFRISLECKLRPVTHRTPYFLPAAGRRRLPPAAVVQHTTLTAQIEASGPTCRPGQARAVLELAPAAAHGQGEALKVPATRELGDLTPQALVRGGLSQIRSLLVTTLQCGNHSRLEPVIVVDPTPETHPILIVEARIAPLPQGVTPLVVPGDLRAVPCPTRTAHHIVDRDAFLVRRRLRDRLALANAVHLGVWRDLIRARRGCPMPFGGSDHLKDARLSERDATLDAQQHTVRRETTAAPGTPQAVHEGALAFLYPPREW